MGELAQRRAVPGVSGGAGDEGPRGRGRDACVAVRTCQRELEARECFEEPGRLEGAITLAVLDRTQDAGLDQSVDGLVCRLDASPDQPRGRLHGDHRG